MTPRALTWSAQTLRWWRHWSNPSWKLGLPGHGSELKSMELEMQFFRRVAQAIWLIDSSYLDLPPLDSLFGKWEIFLPVFFSFQGSRGRTWTCLHEWVQERLVWQARVQRVEIFNHLLGLLSHDFFGVPKAEEHVCCLEGTGGRGANRRSWGRLPGEWRIDSPTHETEIFESFLSKFPVLLGVGAMAWEGIGFGQAESAEGTRCTGSSEAPCLVEMEKSHCSSPLGYFTSMLIPRIQAVNAAKEHLSKLVPNAKEDLKELAFPDRDGLEIQRLAGLGCTKLSFAMCPVLVGLNI